MNNLLVSGENTLNGNVVVSGAKNAVLPIIAASLLTTKKVVLKNIPHLHDVTTMIELLMGLGSKITVNDSFSLIIDNGNIANFTANEKLVNAMRASILVLGPMVSRYKQAVVAFPGGCSIGSRPVDMHLEALKSLGADIEVNNNIIEAKCSKLVGSEYTFRKVSVTGTENLVMAATLAKGTTVINNAAKEPEVVALAEFLNSMGAKIYGAGSEQITIEGVEELTGCEYSVPGDRVEAGTYAISGAITRGRVKVSGVDPNSMNSVLELLEQTGTKLTRGQDFITVDARDVELKAVDITTSPFPGFPTDMQAQFTILNCVASGSSKVHETVFENRFMHVAELNKMGAGIRVEGSIAYIQGDRKLRGATTIATDLRASACLVLAGLVAEGSSLISNIYHIDRGYERIEEKLSILGAKVRRLSSILSNDVA